jgi:hypothetical protein
MKRLEYCAMVRDLDRIRRGLWLREKGNTSEIEEREIVAIFQIEGSLHIEENIHQLSPVEEDPTQINSVSNP